MRFTIWVSILYLTQSVLDLPDPSIPVVVLFSLGLISCVIQDYAEAIRK